MGMGDDTDDGTDDGSQQLPAGMRYEHGKVVPHLTVDERVAARQGGASARCRERVTQTSRRASSGPTLFALLESQAAAARAIAGADPLWPDAGVAVHLLSRRGADHGGRPGRHPDALESTPNSVATRT